jgi:hypothetical protein
MIDLVKVKALPLTQMAGEDEEETALFKEASEEAIAYLKSLSWCNNILKTYFCFGVGGIVELFLFQVERLANDGKSVNEWLWVIVGDLPSAYLVTDDAQSPRDALQAYCDVMQEWVDSVRSNGDLSQVYPVNAEPTEENASMLSRRVEFLRDEVLPMMAS